MSRSAVIKHQGGNLPFPGEIRNGIYRPLLVKEPRKYRTTRQHHEDICGIFGVSKAIRYETRFFYHSANIWWFENAKTIIRFLVSLSPDQLQHIHRIFLYNYPCDDMEERYLAGLLQKCWQLRLLYLRITDPDFYYRLCISRRWNSKKLAVARLRGLDTFQIALPHRVDWVFLTRPTDSFELFIERGEYYTRALPWFVPHPQMMQARDPLFLERKKKQLHTWWMRQQRIARRIKIYRQRYGPCNVITRAQHKHSVLR